MSTPLLLVYSAIAQGVPLENAINMVYVSSEVVHTRWAVSTWSW